MFSSSRLSWIIITSLSFIILLQIVAIIIILIYFAPTSNDETALESDANTTNESVNFRFDNDGNLAGFNAICTSDDGAYFKIFKAGNYEEYNSASSLVSSGDYSIINDSLISISPDRTLYYDGFYIADGTTLYDCEATPNTGDSK